MKTHTAIVISLVRTLPLPLGVAFEAPHEESSGWDNHSSETQQPWWNSLCDWRCASHYSQSTCEAWTTTVMAISSFRVW